MTENLTANLISMSAFRRNLENFDYASLSIPVVILLILTMLVLPLPPLMLDLLFTLNILMALVVIMVAVNTKAPMDFSSFPTVILFSTMLRLGLNVASTRVVLLEGHNGGDSAGKVIEAFGAFVIGGNYVVGFIVFAVLMIINFIVITKGAGRASEVAARFTLDAMPGKQMAIDADLSAGVIDQDEAKTRRTLISQESDFYGTMDGASKYVRGDAVAGLLILLINLVGGITIGLLQYDLSFEQATKAYVLLTIGDGLVAQIPALIISLATAVIVSRVVTAESAPEQAASQLANPNAFYITGSILLLLGTIPGMPNMVFLSLGLVAVGIGYMAGRQALDETDVTDLFENEESTGAASNEGSTETSWEAAEQVDTASVELGYGLIPLVDEGAGGTLLKRIKGIRKKLSSEVGFLLPPIRIKDNLDITPESYRIVINGTVRGFGEIEPSREMAINPGNISTPLNGSPTKDPAFGLSAYWINSDERDFAEANGYTVVDSGTVISTHLNAVLADCTQELMSFDIAQSLLDRVEAAHPKLVEDLIPERITLSNLVQVLQNLLSENVTLRDMRTILETLSIESQISQDATHLTAAIRPKLARLIIQNLVDEGGNLPIITLDPELENLFSDLVSKSQNPREIALEPTLAEKVFSATRSAVRLAEERGLSAVLVVSPLLRVWASELLRRSTKDLTVLSYAEIPDDQAIEAITTISTSIDTQNVNN